MFGRFGQPVHRAPRCSSSGRGSPERSTSGHAQQERCLANPRVGLRAGVLKRSTVLRPCGVPELGQAADQR
jgi:hypothetical protein